MSDEPDPWSAFAACCMECGRVRDRAVDMQVEPWWCARCVQDWERFMCGCPDCQAADVTQGNVFHGISSSPAPGTDTE